MKARLKRGITLLLAVALLVSVFPVGAAAATKKFTYTAAEINSIDKKFDQHEYVLKQNFWANTKELVRFVQVSLTELGYGNLDDDGVFGSATKKAVQNFQSKNGLTKDGCVGTKTWDALVKKYRAEAEKYTSKTEAKTEIKFSSVSGPGTIEQGSGQHISGKISSTNSKISSIKAVVTNSSGKSVLSKTVKPNAKSYELYDSDLDWGLSFGDLAAGDYTLKYTVKAADGTSSSKSVTFTVKGNDSNSSATAAGYSPSKALDFAEDHAYTNSKWLCSEYVSRALRAGKLGIDIFPGVGDLYRALNKMDGVERYTLKVESDGRVLPKNNKGKLASGDVIVIKDTKEPDGAYYVHTVMVGDVSSNGIKVYAHNNSYCNETYYGFNYCGYCKKSSNSEIVAYVFHFVE